MSHATPQRSAAPGGGVTVRPARMDDVAWLAALEEQAFACDRIAARGFRRFIAGGRALLLVAEAEAKPLGYALVLLRKGSERARLYSIAVAAGARGHGAGAALLAACEREALARGRRSMRLEVRRADSAAVRFYRRHGYEEFGLREGYYQDGAPALRMEKALRTEKNLDAGGRHEPAPPEEDT